LIKYFNPVKVVKTDKWLIELKDLEEKLNITSPFILTSPGNRKRLNLNSIFEPEAIFDNFNTNPTFDDCNRVIQFCQEKVFDGIIAIGGGSTMDLAKVAVAHVCLELTNIYDLISFNNNYPKSIPSIFLPTTHGTASEVTMWGTIWNMDEKKKYSISHPSLYPSIAILDGKLTLTLPLDISIITMMDALSHGFESIWNKNKNPISTNYAVEAISLILKNSEELKQNLLDLEVRNNLLIAANKAGLAFSNTKTAAAHSISYPLTAYFNIPHGIASSFALIPLLEINGPLISNDLDKILVNLGLGSVAELISMIKAIPNNNIKYNLRNWGLKESDLDFIAEQSFTKGRMDNNIVDLTKSDVRKILETIY